MNLIRKQISRMDATKRNCYKNLLVLSSGWFLFFMSFASIRSMTSSVNHEKSIGLFSMACTYGGYMLACCFTSGIVKIFSAKNVLISSLVFQILFVLSNFTKSFYVVLPAAILGGISQAAMWTAVGSYVMHLVSKVEQIPNTSLQTIKSLQGKFFGVFFTFASLAPVVGALLTALVLSLVEHKCLDTGQNIGLRINKNHGEHNYSTIGPFVNKLGQYDPLMENKHKCGQLNNKIHNNGLLHSNTSLSTNHEFYQNYNICGPNFCHSSFAKSKSRPVSQFTRLLLFGLYGVFLLMAILTYMLALDSDGRNHCFGSMTRSSRCCHEFVENIKATFRLISTYKFIFLMPIISYHGLQIAFFSGEVTKAFPGCLYGLDYIGYFVTCFGISAAITSFISGCASGFVNRSFFLVLGASINIFTLVGMWIWDARLKDVLFVFSLAALWGISEGIWITHLNSLVGSAFPGKPEEAYSAFNLVLAFGLTTGYLYSHYVCMNFKLIITGTMCVLGLIAYFISKKMPRILEDSGIIEVMISTGNITRFQDTGNNLQVQEAPSHESVELLDGSANQDTSQNIPQTTNVQDEHSMQTSTV